MGLSIRPPEGWESSTEHGLRLLGPAERAHHLLNLTHGAGHVGELFALLLAGLMAWAVDN